MRTVILCQPKMGYYDNVARDLPAALLSTASYIYKDYKVIIVDMRVPRWKSKFNEALTKNPICVGITCWTGKQIESALEISKLTKENNKSIPVVWGGMQPSTTQEQTLENQYIDYIVEGEGELIFPNLLKGLEGNLNIAEINGLWFKENDKVKQGINFEKRESLDNFLETICPLSLITLYKYIC